MKKITSIQNTFIKSLILLREKSKSRDRSDVFLVEGKKEILLALKGNYQIDIVLFCSKICTILEVEKISEKFKIIEINKKIYDKISYRNTTEGVIGIAKKQDLSLSKLQLGKNPLILVAESIEKPGNLGAVLRTADAANVDAVIIANPLVNLYNPNVVRSSVGCLFTNQIAIDTTSNIISFLKKYKIKIYSAALQKSVPYHTQKFTRPTAFIIGNETTGLSKEWRNSADKNIIIPMQGIIDSMNVSVSAAILIFEAKRQRGFNSAY